MATTLVRISVSPVKGLGLVEPREIELTREGPRDDRRFFLIGEDGLLRNGKHVGPLVRVRPYWDGATSVLTLTFPDGRVVAEEIRRGPEVTTSFYGRAVRGHLVQGELSPALSDLAGEALRLVERDDGQIAADVAPLTIVTGGSLARLDADARRFRMTLELDAPEAHAEDGWSGSRARLGEARLLVGGPVGRCAVTTHDPDTGVRDRDVLREIADYRGIPDEGPAAGQICFGVYAAVLEPGRVALGESLQLEG